MSLFSKKIPVPIVQSGVTALEVLASATNGTSVKIQIDFGDGYNWTYSFNALQPWNNSNIKTNHTYTVGGMYNVTAFFNNSVSNATLKKPVWIIAPLGNFYLNTSSNIVRSFTAVAFRVVQLSGDPAVLTNVTFQWGDGTADASLVFNPTSIYYHSFNYSGNITVTAIVKNAIGQRIVTKDLLVVHQIKNMQCSFEPKNIWLTQTQQINITFDRGSHVNITFNNGVQPAQVLPLRQCMLNKHSNIFESLMRIIFSSDVNSTPIELLNNYSSVTDVTVLITACNIINCQNCTQPVSILEKIDPLKVEFKANPSLGLYQSELLVL